MSWSQIVVALSTELENWYSKFFGSGLRVQISTEYVHTGRIALEESKTEISKIVSIFRTLLATNTICRIAGLRATAANNVYAAEMCLASEQSKIETSKLALLKAQ